ncbi:MAG: hypothetical protein L3J57_06500 [Desulfuromusa sp.]|nr:hypothetical protein [Desulfuromusa sp.]
MKDVSVVYQDGMMGIIDPKKLQGLIERDRIIKFQRSDGWVYPEIDPIRILADTGYQGSERRFM